MIEMNDLDRIAINIRLHAIRLGWAICLLALIALLDLFFLLLPSMAHAKVTAPKSTGPQILKPEPLEACSEKLIEEASHQCIIDRFVKLLDHHPNKHVKEGFIEAFSNSQITVNFNTRPNQLAGLAVIEAKNNTEMQTISIGEKFYLPILVLNPRMLSRLTTSERVLAAMLALTHEYTHFQQLKRVKEEKSILPFLKSCSNSSENCQEIWKNEKDAYFETCRDAIEWGMPDYLGGLCNKASSRKKFDRALLVYLRDSLQENYLSCLAEWEKYAKN